MAGTYEVTVTDANGCTATAEVTVTQPAPIELSVNVDANVSCNGGTDGAATVNAAGGTAPYSYSWTNGATTANFTGSAAGRYTVIVTDANGCTASASVTINQPAALSAAAFVENNASCSGKSDGSASVVGVGGTSPYTYLWSDGTTSDMLTSITAGSYAVTVTDANGCSASSELVITEPVVLTATAMIEANVSCNGGSDGAATVSLSGGTMPYTYAWSNDATTATATGLAAGAYTVTVTDKNACSAMVEVTVTEPTALAAELVATPDYGLFDGTAAITVTGGTSDYSYAWNSDPVQTTAIATALPAGLYTVTVTDANACVLTDSVTVILAGDTCTTAMSIDSLFGGELDVVNYSRSYTNGAYGMDSLSDESLIEYFGTDTLFHPVWFRFTGDGNIYHIRTSDCDDDSALADTRALLYAGGCSIDSLVRRSDNYSETDSIPLIEVQTEVGEEYALLIDGADTTNGSFCLSVMQVATVPTREVRPRNLAIYPNPTSGTIRFGRMEVRDVSVFDGYGRRAAHYTNPGNEVDITELPAGIYYLRITDVDNGMYTSRVIKQ